MTHDELLQEINMKIITNDSDKLGTYNIVVTDKNLLDKLLIDKKIKVMFWNYAESNQRYDINQSGYWFDYLTPDRERLEINLFYRSESKISEFEKIRNASV